MSPPSPRRRHFLALCGIALGTTVAAGYFFRTPSAESFLLSGDAAAAWDELAEYLPPTLRADLEALGRFDPTPRLESAKRTGRAPSKALHPRFNVLESPSAFTWKNVGPPIERFTLQELEGTVVLEADSPEASFTEGEGRLPLPEDLVLDAGVVYKWHVVGDGGDAQGTFRILHSRDRQHLETRLHGAFDVSGDQHLLARYLHALIYDLAGVKGRAHAVYASLAQEAPHSVILAQALLASELELGLSTTGSQ